MESQSPFSQSALERAVPRYTSYPTAPHFNADVGPEIYRRWLNELAEGTRASLYLHLPFCQSLCWFCACRTQGTRQYVPVTRYLGYLEREIETVAAELGGPLAMTQMHWGGGSPSILRAEDIKRLAHILRRAFPALDGADFDVELDPRDMSAEKLDAFVEAGVTRFSIGVQDFAQPVQAAIGRLQDRRLTEDLVVEARRRGISSVNLDLVYGLPAQTAQSLAATIGGVLALEPDRVALFGYAHVPAVSRRQAMIDPEVLPGLAERREMVALARRLMSSAGYVPIGIDHFARPGDALAQAASTQRLRRNFQGYTSDEADTLIGLGASAIGHFPRGYVQNEASTAGYQRAVVAGGLATARGRVLTLEDQIRAAVISEILCSFALDLSAVSARYGDLAAPVLREAEALIENAPAGALSRLDGTDGFEIQPRWHSHARLIAAHFDAYLPNSVARHSLAV
ncbi:MAG: oxygen-independent coproporphyrinogen III oxidase [Pseudomonadota bacterium]